jgi:lipid II:glycine glycyltransferase (peptidoglycan interpeptide bridge formation enzyme)
MEPLSSIHNTKYTIQKTIDIEPSRTILLDLGKTEDELLAAMHQKTRYNIKLAEKKGVAVAIGSEKNFDEYWRLMQATAGRDSFRLHDREHYRKMINSSQGMMNLLLADYQGKAIAGNIMAFYGDTATYVHGASSNEHRDVMAPYALQWAAIKTAKAQGCKYYDFYGIDENKWPGVTRFKRGFGGSEVEYPGTMDVIFNKAKYSIYKISRNLRRQF